MSSTVNQAAWALIRGAERQASEEAKESPFDFELAMSDVVAGELRDFKDVRAMAWFAHMQMLVAITATDHGQIFASIQRAHAAVFRVAAALAADRGPPSPDERSH